MSGPEDTADATGIGAGLQTGEEGHRAYTPICLLKNTNAYVCVLGGGGAWDAQGHLGSALAQACANVFWLLVHWVVGWLLAKLAAFTV